MRLISLLAGYAAGLAVAMKYRKEAGTSKLPEDTTKSTLDAFMNEVVDIHKEVFADAKKLFEAHFSDVHDLDGLKAKVETFVSSFVSEVDDKVALLKEEGADKKAQAETIVQDLYNQKIAFLDEAKAKALELAGDALDTVEPWIADARKTLDTHYKKAKTKTNKIL